MAYPVKDKHADLWRVYFRPVSGAKPRLWKGKRKRGSSGVHVFTSRAEADEAAEWVRVNLEGRGPTLVNVEADATLKEFLRAHPQTEGTRDFYGDALGRLFAWMGAAPISEWQPRDLEKFIAQGRKGRKTKRGKLVPGWSPRTAAKMVEAARVFIKWARERKKKVADFAGPVRIPKQDNKERRPRTLEESAAILAQAEKEGSYLLLPVALARYAGLSYGDISEITWAEVDFERGLLLRGRKKRGGKGKPVPIAAPLRALLLSHQSGIGGAKVCPGLDPAGKSDHHFLHALERRAGVVVEKGDGFHSFRHLFGTSLADAGATLAEIRDAMQHAPNSRETLKYLHSTEEGVRSVIDRAARATGAS